MKTVLCIILAGLLISTAHAGNLRFETTAEGIIESLSVPPKENRVKTRSLNLQNVSAPAPAKTRSIRVLEKIDGDVVGRTITVEEQSEQSGVNLRIEFDVNSCRIRSGSCGLLDELGKALTSQQLESIPIRISGHTDSDGYNEYNLELSMNRAAAVRHYLTGHFDISPERLNVVGFGEAMPLVPNTTPSNKQINRRVEIRTGDSL